MKIKIGFDVIDDREIAIIGEYVIDGGPFVEDHFLVLILNSDRMIDYPIQTATEVLNDLRKCGLFSELKLCNKTKFSSRIIFPNKFMDHLLFDCPTTSHGFRGILQKIKQFGIAYDPLSLTDEIKKYLLEVKNINSKQE
ncbi:MAG: hypothetical protein LBK60_03615 [Verrucomicrobiales bacterium]|jgi:hypothetical protein|nr:hypothetical protein [Verrucomicrobiales bacterium]